MGKNFKYVSLDAVFSKIYRDLGISEISEIDIVEWCGEALELIGAVKIYEEAVDILDIKNHQTDLPRWLHSIIQVAKNNDYKKRKAEYLEDNLLEQPNEEQKKLCDCEEGLLKSNINICSINNNWLSQQFKLKKFTPIRLANHTFFNSLVCYEDSELYNSFCCNDEYTIVDNKIRTSFKEGQIAISYYKQKVDKKTGFPLIPDNTNIITALSWYVAWKYFSRLWFKNREGYTDKMQYAESQWQWYCKQSTTNLNMLYGVDEHQNFLEERFRLIPNRTKYYSFFGNLGKGQLPRFKITNNV